MPVMRKYVLLLKVHIPYDVMVLSDRAIDSLTFEASTFDLQKSLKLISSHDNKMVVY